MPYVAGQYYQICDVCGFKFLSNETRLRWDNLLVCPADWETDHPQKYVRVLEDSQGVPIPRPPPEDAFVEVSYITYPFPAPAPPPAPSGPTAVGRMTFDAAAEGGMTITNGFEYTGEEGGLIGVTRDIQDPNGISGATIAGNSLGTKLWVADGELIIDFAPTFSKFSMFYAAHTNITVDFYNNTTLVDSSGILPQTALGTTGDTFRAWGYYGFTFPVESSIFPNKIKINGTPYEFCIDNITCGSLDPINLT